MQYMLTKHSKNVTFVVITKYSKGLLQVRENVKGQSSLSHIDLCASDCPTDRILLYSTCNAYSNSA